MVKRSSSAYEKARRIVDDWYCFGRPDARYPVLYYDSPEMRSLYRLVARLLKKGAK